METNYGNVFLQQIRVMQNVVSAVRSDTPGEYDITVCNTGQPLSYGIITIDIMRKKVLLQKHTIVENQVNTIDIANRIAKQFSLKIKMLDY